MLSRWNVNASFMCGFCGELVETTVDLSAGGAQHYVEDCAVCCRPMEIFVRCRPGEVIGISATSD